MWSGAPWCVACETAFDTWVRQHAADILWSVLGGGVVLAVVGVGAPLLVGPLASAAAAFAGFGTLAVLHRASVRRRRQQFIAGVALPRAYLPSPDRNNT